MEAMRPKEEEIEISHHRIVSCTICKTRIRLSFILVETGRRKEYLCSSQTLEIHQSFDVSLIALCKTMDGAVISADQLKA